MSFCCGNGQFSQVVAVVAKMSTVLFQILLLYTSTYMAVAENNINNNNNTDNKTSEENTNTSNITAVGNTNTGNITAEGEDNTTFNERWVK